jgi:hypothetical protein
VIATATCETFAPHVGERFAAMTPSGMSFELVLTSAEASRHGAPDGARRAPFSLLFHAEGEERALPQQTFALRHARLGAFELFLVPLGPDERGMRYEAVIG